ncbi:MAG TPA: general stress protein [Chondromyces sp.]|nr:general stress protein [Chondromyces sp.]
MKPKRIIGVFESELTVIREVEELKVAGYDGSQIYAITNDADLVLLVKNRSAAQVQSAGPSFMEKLKSILSKEKPVLESLIDFGLTSEEANQYYEDVENGKILLVVDEKETLSKQASGNAQEEQNHLLFSSKFHF